MPRAELPQGEFPNVPVESVILFKDMKLFGKVIVRHGNETTILWDSGGTSVVSDDDDDPDLFEVVKIGYAGPADAG